VSGFAKGDRVVVLASFDGLSPSITGPGIVDFVGKSLHTWAVLMVPELLPEAVRGRQVGQVVHETRLQRVWPGMTLEYPDLGLKWTEDGVEDL